MPVERALDAGKALFFEAMRFGVCGDVGDVISSIVLSPLGTRRWRYRPGCTAGCPHVSTCLMSIDVMLALYCSGGNACENTDVFGQDFSTIDPDCECSCRSDRLSVHPRFWDGTAWPVLDGFGCSGDVVQVPLERARVTAGVLLLAFPVERHYRSSDETNDRSGTSAAHRADRNINMTRLSSRHPQEEMYDTARDHRRYDL